MYLKKLLTGLVLVLVTTSCVSAEKQEGIKSADEGKMFTMEQVQTALKSRGRRVVVLFSDESGHMCPGDIRTLDNVCLGKGYLTDDTSTICRVAQDNAGPNNIKRIVWDSDEGPAFSVTFPNFPDGESPCLGGWQGDQFKERHVCKLKNAEDLDLGQGDVAYMKYDIAVADQACPVLDPYFIVRK